MENNIPFRISPSTMAIADLLGPLTTPLSAQDFKDKVKITIKRNAGVKCLKVPKPCDLLAPSIVRDPGESWKEPKPCKVLKISLGCPTKGIDEATAGPKQYRKMSLKLNKKEKLQFTRGSSSPTYLSSHIKKKAQVFEAASGAHKTHNKEQSCLGKETQSKLVCVREECFQNAKDDLLDTVDTQEIYIKEEPLTDEEELSDHMHRIIKHESVCDGEDDLGENNKSFHIKEEPDFEKEEEDSSKIITVKIKEELPSSEEELDVGDFQINHIREEFCLPQHEGFTTSSRITHKTLPPGQNKDRILPQTLGPLVIRNPRLTDRKMVLPKETKMGLLKKLMELGTPATDSTQEILTCTPMKMYKCSKCGRYFTSRLRLQRHFLAHKKYKVACPDCGKLFACKATVLRHRVVHSKEKPFPCSFCEKRFSTDKGREIHERRHTGDKPFVCSDCGKTFLFKAQLKTHQMIHTGERFSCHECGRCYRTKPGLVLHMRIHSGDVPYFCPECGKGFVQKSNLKNHLHTHSTEKPFTCMKCNKGFRQKYNLKQHMSVHAAKECEKYSCSECGKSYKRKADYRWHMLIHLGEK
ncbi:uncharacterized protein [Pyxicephalus adspersus]|uniref:uncharacterized protein n=1 Tax=Pyxicephalus adspersus TaxID=30357 RepID=UPI003B5CD96E